MECVKVVTDPENETGMETAWTGSVVMHDSEVRKNGNEAYRWNGPVIPRYNADGITNCKNLIRITYYPYVLTPNYLLNRQLSLSILESFNYLPRPECPQACFELGTAPYDPKEAAKPRR